MAKKLAKTKTAMSESLKRFYKIIKRLQAKDLNLIALAKSVRRQTGTRKKYYVDNNNILLFCTRLVLPPKKALLKEIIA